MFRRMKRPHGLWLLLSAGVVCLCFKDVSCVRATALIFAKSSTSTSTTTAPGDAEVATNKDGTTEEPAVNVTKSPLTGNPQMDYIYDPNLPRELNGYNLTDYPFFDRLPPPEEMDFKCDGLHDGFYASVPHKCQVYHHCLAATRFDFLCANYTAFDQKTFICHFVSEVDCVNSKNFWHRNDALYETTTTTTVKPIIIYQPPPQPHSALTPTGPGGGNRKPSSGSSGGRRRRPYRRRRPQYDYYDDEEEADDYYDDEPRYQVTPGPQRPRNKRPRPRPRPVYDDEYEYEDERYDRRGDKRRGMYDDRRRYKEDRRKYDDEYEDAVEEDGKLDRGGEDRDRKKDSDGNRKRQRPSESSDNPRYDGKGARRRKPAKINDEYYDDEQDQQRPQRKSTASSSKDPIEDRPVRKPSNADGDKSSSNGDGKRSRRPNNKPKDDHYPDEEEPSSTRSRSRPQSTKDKKSSTRDPSVDDAESSPSRKINDNPPEGVPLVKPSSGSSIYNRPRAAPKIRPPVPKNEQDKYSYKTSTIKPKTDDEEYYDEYEEEEPAPKRNKPKNDDSRRQSNDRLRDTTKMSASRQRNHSRRPNYDQDEAYHSQRPLSNKNAEPERKRKRPLVEVEYEEDAEYEEEKPIKEIPERSLLSTSTTTTTTSKPARSNGDRFKEDRLRKTSIGASTSSTTSTTTEVPDKKEKPEMSAVRIIKRPFLPSRGGSPFSARGLLPVGSKAALLPPAVEEVQKSPPRFQQSNKIERNPLDIKEDEYDVTLNDALNPTLPNLPVRNFATSAFSSPGTDYLYTNFRRSPQREYIEPQVSTSQKQPVRFQEVVQQPRYSLADRYQTPAVENAQRYQPEAQEAAKSNQQRLEPQPNQRLGTQQYVDAAQSSFAPMKSTNNNNNNNNREQLVNSNSDYRAQFSHTAPVTYQFRTGPRVTHIHAQPFYTTF